MMRFFDWQKYDFSDKYQYSDKKRNN